MSTISTDNPTTTKAAEPPAVLLVDRDELSHHLRALSHDMVANFMVLDQSFSQLKRSLADRPPAEPGQQVAHVEACLRESKRLLDDLVGLARTGKVEMEPSRVDLGAVVDEVLFEQREVLARRNVRVDVRRPLGDVWCNRHRLKQIIANLVRNAVLHGCDLQRPRITISSATATGGKAPATDGGRIAIRVHDNGPGIDPQFHEEIFLPGRQLSQAARDGSGMGLAIVKKIAQHYGGSVRVDPKCRSGTAMVVSLPAASGGFAGHAPHWGPPVTAEDGGRSLEHDAPHEVQPVRPHQPYTRRPAYRRP